ncbi:MAG TPA: hypothetical protein VNW47_16460 [Terriglobales bacterium]|nr:hypothetical protein [Terriglobales bacterium]
MEALYAVLGLVLGIALAEAYRRIRRGRGLASGARLPGTSQGSRRFTAQDFYDR